MAREDEQSVAVGDSAADQHNRDTIARLEAEVAALRDQLLRALADQENVRRPRA